MKDTFRKKFSRKHAIRRKRFKKDHHGKRPTMRSVRKAIDVVK